MQSGAAHKPVVSVSIPPDRRPVFYTSLAQFRQRYFFITNSGLVARAVIEAAQTEPQLIEFLTRLPQKMQIIQQGSVYLWQCSAGHRSALTLLEAARYTLPTLLNPAPSSTTGSPCLLSWDAGTDALDGIAYWMTRGCWPGQPVFSTKGAFA